MPLDSINSVLVITPQAAYLDEIKYWISAAAHQGDQCEECGGEGAAADVNGAHRHAVNAEAAALLPPERRGPDHEGGVDEGGPC